MQAKSPWVIQQITDLQWRNWGSEGLMYNYSITRLPGTPIYGINCQVDGTGDPQKKPVGIIGYYATNARYPNYLFIQTGISGSGPDYPKQRRQWINEHFVDASIRYYIDSSQV